VQLDSAERDLPAFGASPSRLGSSCSGVCDASYLTDDSPVKLSPKSRCLRQLPPSGTSPLAPDLEVREEQDQELATDEPERDVEGDRLEEYDTEAVGRVKDVAWNDVGRRTMSAVATVIPPQVRPKMITESSF